MTKAKWIGLVLFTVIFVTGCTLFPSKYKANKDGPPLVKRDVSKVPDAKPKVEPFSKYGNPKSYVVFGKKYHVMNSNKDYKAVGTASWYGQKFHGRRTSSGEPYDMFTMTAAHKTLPLPTYAKVKNLNNGKEVIVKINDRGPFVEDRLIDLSYAAAKKLGVYDAGTARVQITAIDPGKFYKNNAPVTVSKAEPLHQPVYIQLGAFRNKENADKLADRVNQVASKWEKVMVSVLAPVTDAAFYKVRIGPIIDNNVVENLKSDLAQLSIDNLAVVLD